MASFSKIKSTQTDKSSPGSDQIFDKLRQNQDSVHESIVGTGRTITLNGNPSNDTSGEFAIDETITGSDHYANYKLFVDDEDSAAFGKSWMIGTNGANSIAIATTGVNLFTEGLRDNDTCTIRYSGGLNTAGVIGSAHTHNGENSPTVTIPDAVWYSLMFNE